MYEFYSRSYDPVNATWNRQDEYRGRLNDPQSVLRYLYVKQSPVNLKDMYGFAIQIVPVIVVGGLIALDYGLDAYDIYQANEILNNPESTPEERKYANELLAITIEWRNIESQTAIGAVLPIDDICRWGWKGIKRITGSTVVERLFGWTGRKIVQEAGEEALEKEFRDFTASNFRENLSRLTGKNLSEEQAHHVFPQKFEEIFRSKGIEIHDPKFGSWWDVPSHQKSSYEYNELWDKFLQSDPTKEQVFEFSKELAQKYGYELNF